jgi:hypothetical protein
MTWIASAPLRLAAAAGSSKARSGGTSCVEIVLPVHGNVSHQQSCVDEKERALQSSMHKRTNQLAYEREGFECFANGNDLWAPAARVNEGMHVNTARPRRRNSTWQRLRRKESGGNNTSSAQSGARPRPSRDPTGPQSNQSDSG